MEHTTASPSRGTPLRSGMRIGNPLGGSILVEARLYENGNLILTINSPFEDYEVEQTGCETILTGHIL